MEERKKYDYGIKSTLAQVIFLINSNHTLKFKEKLYTVICKN